MNNGKSKKLNLKSFGRSGVLRKIFLFFYITRLLTSQPLAMAQGTVRKTNPFNKHEPGQHTKPPFQTCAKATFLYSSTN